MLKFEKGALRPSLVLGEAFVPAETNDEPDRFCKPTDVAVSKETGQIFVADGSVKLRTYLAVGSDVIISCVLVGTATGGWWCTRALASIWVILEVRYSYFRTRSLS